ncbi:MAG TPA: hypothetical protein VKB93_29530 [Thermoanaerobaculia bacterium]|nr:hypothetical protein [Thermoanaerobaculia bacterium]
MKARFFALTVAAAGLAGCATDPTATAPGPAYEREIREGRPGLFGDLTWNFVPGQGRVAAERTAAPASAAEQEEFKKWRESAGRSERQEFEEWRAWQEWKRQNPK